MSYGQYKTQTALLVTLKAEGASVPSHAISDPGLLEVIAFGDEAEVQYGHIPAEGRPQYCFCKWFKMLLHSETTSSESDPVIESDENGLRITLSAALALSIGVFKKTAIDHLARTYRRTSSPAINTASSPDIVWILTVPAIWSDKAKYLMRCAAYNAKLVPNFDSNNLILCLEPEGISFAALFDASCDDTFIRDYVGEESKESFSTKDVFSRRGNKFLVVDAGGGTVDFGAYEVVSTHPFQVKQLAAPVGGPFGSTQVDLCLKEFIFELIGPEATAVLKKDIASVYELLSKWETVKINAGHIRNEDLSYNWRI